MHKRSTVLAWVAAFAAAAVVPIAISLASSAQAATPGQVTRVAAATSADTTPPSVPTGLGYRINCALDFTLTWTASTDNVGVAGYDIYRAIIGGPFAAVGTSTTTSFAGHLSGVWQYEVRARDAAGNVSAFTAPISIIPPPCPTTPPSSPPPSTGPDTQPPTVPGTPTATVNCGVANLTWAASVDNVGVLGYEVWRATGSATGATFQLAATVSTNADTQTGPGIYQFKVRAFDAANNDSAFSSPITVYVPACPASSPPSTGCTASFTVASGWSGGFQGQVTVTNTGATATTSWTVTLTLGTGQKITQIWGGRTSSTASPYVITNESYNGVLAPGAAITFGFLATSPGTGGGATGITCSRTP